MSDSSFSAEKFHAAVERASAQVDPLPPLDASIKASWWRDFVEWVDKQLAPISLGPVNLEWVGSVLVLLAWVLGISVAIYLLYRLAKFYLPLRTADHSQPALAYSDLRADRFAMAEANTPRAKLRGLWRVFIEKTNLSRATTPREFWQQQTPLLAAPLSPEWLYERMFGPRDPSDADLEVARQRFEAISKARP